MTESLLFLTGHLAHDNLCRELEALPEPPFTWRVENIRVKVAALMTTSIISRRLENTDGIDRVILPGLVLGELDELQQRFGIPFERGPVDLRDLPEFFGSPNRQQDLSTHAVDIFAEIVDAPHLELDEILASARDYQQQGADVIDIGCLPDIPFPHLADTVALLKQEGFRVSVDSLDTEDLLTGGRAGADYLLSLKESTLWLLDEVDSVPVLIPEQQQDLPSLYRAIEGVQKKGRAFFADPILDPFPFGFTDAIVRYHTLRADHPACRILMGTGNVTELIDADTGGITAVLMSIITELRIDALLTTQVSGHARSVVRETDLARRIMYASRRDGSLPRRYDDGLMMVHDKKPFPYSAAEIAELAAAVTDPSYRIQVSDDGIHLYNRDGLAVACDPFDLQEGIDVGDDLSHMFYLGVELGKASIAWQLGKRYLQDNDIDWGVAGRVDS
ncbi:MAG: dihydropteroate synthase [Gammaproteobacteria bacterium]|nr:dihydropteroate synthase [Gammaproteobacteria bacterium]